MNQKKCLLFRIKSIACAKILRQNECLHVELMDPVELFQSCLLFQTGIDLSANRS